MTARRVDRPGQVARPRREARPRQEDRPQQAARPRREFAAAIAACLAGAGLVLIVLRQGWARVTYTAPAPLPSGSLRVTGQSLLPAAAALALAALACLAAVIATRGLARRLAGLVMAGLGAWIAWLASQPVRAAAVISAAASQAASAGQAGGSPSGGNSAISGSGGQGGALPALGVASHVARSAPGALSWQVAAVAGAVAVIAAGLLTLWRGPGWAVMSARFDRPGDKKPAPAGPATAPPVPGETDSAAIWEALDHGVDLTAGPSRDEPG